MTTSSPSPRSMADRRRPGTPVRPKSRQEPTDRGEKGSRSSATQATPRIGRPTIQVVVWRARAHLARSMTGQADGGKPSVGSVGAFDQEEEGHEREGERNDHHEDSEGEQG